MSGRAAVAERAELMSLPMLTVVQAAKAMGLSERKMKRLINDGEGPRAFEIEGAVFARPDDLHSWAARLASASPNALGEVEAAEYLTERGISVSGSWMRKARMSGRGPKFSKISATGGICYPTDELDAFLAKEKSEPVSKLTALGSV